MSQSPDSDRAVAVLLSHGLRASELSVLNVNHWNGKLTVHRSKGEREEVIVRQNSIWKHI